jgi:four helix bundle protein
VREKSFEFALGVVRLDRELNSRREYVLSKQLLKAGTSIGANVEEALAAQSRRDFLSKMSIASKEARECHYWLRIVREAELLPRDAVDPHLEKCEELIRLLTAIVKATRETS